MPSPAPLGAWVIDKGIHMTEKENKVVGNHTRQTTHEKIKAALAKKPTAAMLNNQGIPVEQLNKLVSNPTTPTASSPGEQPFQRVIRNAKKKRAMERRPMLAEKTAATDLSNDPAPLPDCTLYPVPEWFGMKNAKVSVIIPLFKSEKVVRDQIKTWPMQEGVEIIYVDDCCTGDSKAAVLAAWENRGLMQGVGKIVVAGENCGYGRACNIGAMHASGDHLIFLNADTTVTPGWIDPMVELFADPTVGVVGNMQLKEGGEWHGTVDSAGSGWNWSSGYFEHIGRHLYHGKHLVQPMRPEELPDDLKVVSEREMVTGCCFAMKKSLFDDMDGFDPRYRIGYWEDSDLCMRVKELGYKILFQPRSVIWHKLSHSNSGGHAHYRRNTELFRNRWINSGRMDPLLFTPRPGGPPRVTQVLVKRLAANGDVLMATAILPALKKKWPNCLITFSTTCEQVLHGNKYIDKIVTDAALLKGVAFDYIINLDLAYEYHPKWSILKSFAHEAGVATKDCRANMAVKALQVSLPQKYIVMHAKREEGFGWVGRNWRGDRFMEIAARLRRAGHKVICVGGGGDWLLPNDLDLRGRTNIQELATVMKGASFFVGMDSMPMHLAQIFDVPGVVFFGSIKAQHRLTGSKLRAVTAPGLDCLGCHHEQKAPSLGTSVCKRGDSACEGDLTTDSFWSAVEDMLANKKSLPVM